MPGTQAQPKVSIVTVSLNQGQFIGDTLRSVREQTYPNIEHIVMDGGSTDNTLDLIRQHEKECSFPLQWCSESDRGQSHAYNKAFALCTGEWVLYLNSSDYLAGPDAIEQALACMQDKPGYEMYAFAYLVTDEEGGEARAYERTIPVAEEGGEVVLRRIHDTDSHHLPHEATFFQRGLVERVGGYSEGYRWHVDLDFFCRALKRAPCGCSPSPASWSIASTRGWCLPPLPPVRARNGIGSTCGRACAPVPLPSAGWFAGISSGVCSSTWKRSCALRSAGAAKHRPPLEGVGAMWQGAGRAPQSGAVSFSGRCHG